MIGFGFDIIAAMGRMRIKKKSAVQPFRETLVYRLLLAVASFMFFVFSIYEMVSALRVSNTIAFIISGIAGVLASIGIFYNLGRARDIGLPAPKRHR
jgi:archaellum biogenesis protein FlaJ (TadC family)